jgi:hypothetical protein
VRLSLYIALVVTVTSMAGCEKMHQPSRVAPPTAPSHCRSGGAASPPEEFGAGVTVVPLKGAERDAQLVAELIHRKFTVPVKLAGPVTVPGTFCNATGQVKIEDVVDYIASGPHPRGSSVIVVSIDDVYSNQFDWQFGASDPNSHVGVFSTFRFKYGSASKHVREKRVAVLTYKYVLTLLLGAPYGQDPQSTSLLAPKYSYDQLDNSDEDLCPYRKVVKFHPDYIRCSDGLRESRT